MINVNCSRFYGEMLQERLLRRLVDFAVFNNARIGTMKYLLAIAAADLCGGSGECR